MCSGEKERERESVRVFAKAVGVSFQLLLVLSALLQNPPLTESERESEREAQSQRKLEMFPG